MFSKRGLLTVATATTLLLGAGTATAFAHNPGGGNIISRVQALMAINEARRQLDIIEKYIQQNQPTTTTTPPPPTSTLPNTTTPTTPPTTTTRPPTTTPRPPTTTSQPPVTTTTPPPTTSGDSAASKFNWGTPIARGSDEFNGSSLDTIKWGTYNGPGHDGNGRRVAGNNQVSGGSLVQTGAANGDSAGMASRFGQKYGRWEVRARSYATGTNGNTYHPVLILWPDSNQWPEGAEYDFLENGRPGDQCAEAFLHYPNHQPKRQEHARKCPVDLTQWHNFAIDWRPNLLIGYIDGVEWFRFTGQVANAPGPMHLTIQLDNFHGSGMQPAKFEIDYARAYPPA